MTMVINIAEEFSSHPAGRYRKDGKFSGEKFRDEILVPALKSGETVTVILDGVRSYGSSFLEESFGGLVRVSGLEKSELKKHLIIEAQDEMYETFQRRALKYIEDAKVG